MQYLLQKILLGLGLFVFTNSGGQQIDSIAKWDIQSCFQYALENNIQITTLQLNKQIAQQDLIAAKGVKTPSLSASISTTFNNSNNDISGNGSLTNQLLMNANYLFSSSIVLWNGNYINNNIKQRDLLVQSATLSVQQSQNSIKLFITQAYLNILLNKENLTYIIDLVSSSEARIKQVQTLYNAGSIAKNNLLQVQAQLASDKFLLVQTQNAILQNILLLKQLLQLPSNTAFDIAIPVSIDLLFLIPSLQDVQQSAIQNFPEVKIGKLGVDIATLDIKKAKAGFKPLLTANGSFGTGYNDILTNSSSIKTAYFTQSGNNFYQRVGATLSIPIFSNRINQTNLAKANIGYKQAGFNLQNNQLILLQAIEQAYLNATNSQQAYGAANEQLLAVTETYRITNEQFKLGSINSFDVLLQRNLYVQAVQAFTQSKYTAVLQQKIYQFYMGNPIVL